MAGKARSVTDAELAVLEVLWRLGQATRRQVTDELYPDGGTSHYATVQKLLERLEAKRCVKHVRREGVLVFSPRVNRESLIAQRLEHLADQLCGGSYTPLLQNLMQRKELSLTEIAELRAWLAAQPPANPRDAGPRSK